MERETKKRKMECIEEQEGQKEDEDGDEEKMEKFFALLRRNKEMHDRIRRNSNGIFKEREEIKLKVEQEKVIVNWNPSFQPEDFSEDGKDGSQVAGPSDRKHEEKKKDKGEEDTELDLKLSL
ncbi:hypothetical protein D5086_023978 [Populus alba]|uniref:Uncharacterized protein n=3 Tax=Populus TaxID=3689 RepID=A0ACC4B474_POPAL|nr:protein NIM1-INTERACTING 1-like [Populus alba]KAJ6974112.1 protein NIM1-INTERACTING 1-like [Populus alba x Populus x berolinensis]TKS04203.1 protein NIM1-INTERACTING 1-like [Populus alba]